jgi:hypothetical protein
MILWTEFRMIIQSPTDLTSFCGGYLAIANQLEILLTIGLNSSVDNYSTGAIGKM